MKLPMIVKPLFPAINSQLQQAWVDGRLLPDDLFLITKQSDNFDGTALGYLIHEHILEVNHDDTIAVFSCRALQAAFSIIFIESSPAWTVRAEIGENVAEAILQGWTDVPYLNHELKYIDGRLTTMPWREL